MFVRFGVVVTVWIAVTELWQQGRSRTWSGGRRLRFDFDCFQDFLFVRGRKNIAGLTGAVLRPNTNLDLSLGVPLERAAVWKKM